MIKSLLFVIPVCAIFLSCSTKSFQNKTLSPEQRAEDLINRLTIEEKTSLMMNSSEAIPRLGIEKYDWWNEALHGVARNGTATVFPQAIGMAASFDDILLNQVFTAVSDEARIKNRQARDAGELNRYQGLTMWTPNINIFRDPRWGRGQETYGEDPYLTAKMGVAVITGLQGEQTNGIDKLHACAKHYAIHSGPEWNRHYFNAENIKSRDLWETYLPAFKDAVQKGKVKEVMCAYNRFEGEPCCGSDRLLIQILREQWGYNGIVLSDCGAIRNFYAPGTHLTHPDSSHAVADAILSGTDLECGSSYLALANSVKLGLINEDEINVSLKRVLKARFELGEIDGTSPWDNLPDSLVNGSAHQKLALSMALKSIVLLQNDGILPLQETKKIALLGPNANEEKMQWGNYNGTPKHTITLLEALKEHWPNTNIIYDKVCEPTGNTASLFNECSSDGQKGFRALYWNNSEMRSDPAGEIQYKSAIKVGKRDTTVTGMNLVGISARFNSTLTPTNSGEIEFVFTTSSQVKLFVNGNEIKLENRPIELQIAKMQVDAGTSYRIEIEQVKEKTGQFRFDIIRRVEIDYNRLIKMLDGIDVVIFAGGIDASLEREESNIYAPGFQGGDRTDIELPKAQRDVIARLHSEGKKIILVNFSGSAMGLVPETTNCDAILQAWYPGEAGGKAIVDVLFGNYNPAGRLPVTFYENVSQLPNFQNYDMTDRTYRYMHEKPLFPFGYGLSYTSFEYGKATVDKAEICIDETLTLTVPVTNTGSRNGEEVVQVYLKKMNDSQGPNKTLRAFKRVMIPKGKTANVLFELTSDNLAWWDERTNSVCMHDGNYQLMIGGNSDDESLISLNFIITQ